MFYHMTDLTQKDVWYLNNPACNCPRKLGDCTNASFLFVLFILLIYETLIKESLLYVIKVELSSCTMNECDSAETWHCAVPISE